ncbi:HalOD1 output domain-containing protein [Natrinema salifodinae]|uniref:Halobacterial output domain-containing protein n=1 Tax=Natrinema salifodinae TaxID=1202768 RepID=A0A1I0NBU2_9EURY|nr:HalOD1 output domain-containing protein [Natrinema salifodinae]SEV98528.1 hypothetical protein SAMN05216285_1537 [Natrinema salifodinae]
MTDSCPPSDEHCSPSQAVVDAVATAYDTSPIDFEPPLYDVIEPEALNSIVRSGSRELRVQFRYSGCSVVVTGAGRVDVSAPDEDPRSHEHTVPDE